MRGTKFYSKKQLELANIIKLFSIKIKEDTYLKYSKMYIEYETKAIFIILLIALAKVHITLSDVKILLVFD